MKEITKRFIAGVSAAALFVSAVGSDVFTNWLARTVFADSSTGKNGRSTGFSNLEQDTDGEYYNTGYGLHTNKTATALDDGRTFDVNLESWYVGENPVDVATILDASGSMAWTVDTLEPLTVNIDQIEAKKLDPIEEKYGLDDDGLNSFEKLLTFQESQGGYLPQDLVDLILDPAKTDNSKLGYDKYMYYVYEARSSVSEFVPLGYWDGGADPKTDLSLIGYYPFSGTLENKAPNAEEDAAGKLINHPGSDGIYDTSKEATEPLKAVFVTEEVTQKDGTKKTVVKGLNIADSSSKGAILVASPTTNKFSISFELSVDNSNSGYDEATILYLTDGTNYYKIFRGGNSSGSRLKMSTNKDSPLNANSAVNTEPREWKFTFDFDKKELTIYTTTKNVKWTNDDTGKDTYTVDLSKYPELDVSKLKIYIGGDTTEHKNQNTIYIKNLIINDIEGETETTVANYPLQTEENGLKNTTNSDNPSIFVEQAYNSGGNFGTKELSLRTLDPVFKSDNKALDVKNTSQNGAVLLDAVPELDENGFTISMKLYRTGTLKESQQNIFYLGDKDKSKNYYQYFRSMNAGGYLGISKSEQKDLDKTPTGTDMVYYKGGMASGLDENEVWYTNTLVFKPDPDNDDKWIVTPYINGKAKYQDGAKNFSIDKITVNKSNLVLLLCALKKNGSGSDQYLDDLYIFNDALNATQVAQYFGEKELCDGSTKDKDGNVTKALYHATTIDGEDIAQISDSLANNTKSDERRGWYYVNSHSTWADIEGCLASGKQYIGIKKDDGTDYYSPEDIVTKPSGMDPKLKDDIENNYENNTSITKHADYVAPTTERSIRFYVDGQKHLRCFVWSGADSKENDPRTFCSLVYEKREKMTKQCKKPNTKNSTVR